MGDENKWNEQSKGREMHNIAIAQAIFTTNVTGLIQPTHTPVASKPSQAG